MPNPIEAILEQSIAFTRGARLAEPFITHLVHQGLPANEILRQVRGAGLAVQRQSGLALIRAIKDVAKTGEYIMSVRNDYLPNPDRVAIASSRTRRNFSYTVRLRGTLPNSNETVESHVTVVTDTLINKDAVYQNVATMLDMNPENYAFEVTDMTVVGLKKSNIFAAPGPAL